MLLVEQISESGLTFCFVYDIYYFLLLCAHRDNDITDVFDMTFSVEHDRFGRITNHELKPNGRDVPVTNENKDEYIHLYVQWRFKVGIEKQFNTLQKGFHEIITPNLLKQFDERELELIVSGLGSVDVDDWMNNTRLKHCTLDTDVVRWFWKVRIMYCSCSGGGVRGRDTIQHSCEGGAGVS